MNCHFLSFLRSEHAQVAFLFPFSPKCTCFNKWHSTFFLTKLVGNTNLTCPKFPITVLTNFWELNNTAFSSIDEVSDKISPHLKQNALCNLTRQLDFTFEGKNLGTQYVTLKVWMRILAQISSSTRSTSNQQYWRQYWWVVGGGHFSLVLSSILKMGGVVKARLGVVDESKSKS